MSKKASRAENQQERLITIGWILGFVDGEGCFSVNFVRQADKKEKNRIRKGYKTGFQIFYEFAVTQGESSLRSLEKMNHRKNRSKIIKILRNQTSDSARVQRR